MEKFYFEVTDTYGGEANYCWVKRFEIPAKSLHGALCKLSREMGLNFKCEIYNYRWNAKRAAVCAFLLDDDYTINGYNLISL